MVLTLPPLWGPPSPIPPGRCAESLPSRTSLHLSAPMASPSDCMCTSPITYMPLHLFSPLSFSSPCLFPQGAFWKGASSHWVSLPLHVSFAPLASKEASASLTPLRVALQRSLSVCPLITRPKGQIFSFLSPPIKDVIFDGVDDASSWYRLLGAFSLCPGCERSEIKV